MPKQTNNRGLPLNQIDADNHALWQELDLLQQRQPSDELRRSFYQCLSAQKPKPDWRQWFNWLNQPFVPVALSLLVGLFFGSSLNQGNDQLAALQAQVSTLNTTVALNLMQNSAASERLSGVQMATELDDAKLRQALLARATEDDSQSVRSAAVAALGPHLSQIDIWQSLSQLLIDTQEPLVQLALADLIMRWGDSTQLGKLETIVQANQLIPEINQYVLSKLERSTI